VGLRLVHQLEGGLEEAGGFFSAPIYCSAAARFAARASLALARAWRRRSSSSGLVTLRLGVLDEELVEDLCRPPLAPPFKLVRTRRSSDRRARSTLAGAAPTGCRLSLSSCRRSSRFSLIRADTKGSSSTRTCSAGCRPPGPRRAEEELALFPFPALPLRPRLLAASG
jgi:hypothetical protein